jgi:hypothetical protein
MQKLRGKAKGAFTLSSKVPSLNDQFACQANSSSKKADFAALLDANLSNTRRANLSSMENLSTGSKGFFGSLA